MATTVRQLIPRIFVSHSAKDQEFCNRLVKDLRTVLDDNEAVWYDTLSLTGGVEWNREIKRRLAECKILVVILSPNSADSDRVDEEIDIASQRKMPWVRRGKIFLYFTSQSINEAVSTQS